MGSHVLTGRWFMPCRFAVDEHGYLGDCATPNEPVEVGSRSHPVDFYVDE
jgi:hypothetical protein